MPEVGTLEAAGYPDSRSRPTDSIKTSRFSWPNIQASSGTRAGTARVGYGGPQRRQGHVALTTVSATWQRVRRWGMIAACGVAQVSRRSIPAVGCRFAVVIRQGTSHQLPLDPSPEHRMESVSQSGWKGNDTASGLGDGRVRALQQSDPARVISWASTWAPSRCRIRPRTAIPATFRNGTSWDPRCLNRCTSAWPGAA